MSQNCGICKELLLDNKTSLCQNITTPTLSCNHTFHKDCIENWVKIQNTCPLCCTRFKLTICQDKINVWQTQNQRMATQDWWESRFEEKDIVCNICNKGDNEEVLLLCDECSDGSHTYCIGLSHIPQNNWYCQNCQEKKINRFESDSENDANRELISPNKKNKIQKKCKFLLNNIPSFENIKKNCQKGKKTKRIYQEKFRKIRGIRYVSSVRKKCPFLLGNK